MVVCQLPVADEQPAQRDEESRGSLCRLPARPLLRKPTGSSRRRPLHQLPRQRNIVIARLRQLELARVAEQAVANRCHSVFRISNERTRIRSQRVLAELIRDVIDGNLDRPQLGPS